MYIAMIASECAPVAKVGGLGDVVSGLSRELEIRGNTVEIILPKYDCMRYDHIWGMQKSYENLMVSWNNCQIACTVWFGFVHGRKCFFIEPHSSDNFFNRKTYYGCRDEHLRFAFFSKAALEFLLKTGKRPDVIHTHDWQTALVPTMLYEMYQTGGMENCRVCHTFHNFKHQGIAGRDLLQSTGLGKPNYYYDRMRMGDDYNQTAINISKGAVVYSNFLSTVSPMHAWEVFNTEWGYGLAKSLDGHRNKFGGVLNGLDYEMWNPETDHYIASSYSSDKFDDKGRNKQALRERLWVRQENKPVLAYVGRLDSQKGVALIRHALFHALHKGAQFILLGSSPEDGINAEFWKLKRDFNDNPDCHLEIGYNDELAHLIYAGADMLIVPSIFEPCGLTQMIAMRYGTVPIVRSVGGLADTVFDYNYSELPTNERNGYVFHQPDHKGLESAMDRAIGLWFDYPDEFRELAQNGMHCDYSWNRPGADYVNIYNHIRHK
jgi:starch synthase